MESGPGIDSRNSDGNEVKWGDDDWQLVRRERPHQPCPPTKG